MPENRITVYTSPLVPFTAENKDVNLQKKWTFLDEMNLPCHILSTRSGRNFTAHVKINASPLRKVLACQDFNVLLSYSNEGGFFLEAQHLEPHLVFCNCVYVNHMQHKSPVLSCLFLFCFVLFLCVCVCAIPAKKGTKTSLYRIPVSKLLCNSWAKQLKCVCLPITCLHLG